MNPASKTPQDPKKSPQDVSSPSDPPVWAWELKHDIDEMKEMGSKVDSLANALEEIKLFMTTSMSASSIKTDTATRYDNKSGNVDIDTKQKQSGTGSGSDKVIDENHHSDDTVVSVSSQDLHSVGVDVTKASKRAKAMGTIEGGPYQGTTDQRGFVAFRRMILDTPEVEFGPSTEQQWAFVFFYITANVTVPIKKLITNTCRKNGDTTFKERLTTAWSVLKSYSDLSDELSLTTRWESLSCSDPKGLEQFIADLECIRDQLAFQRGSELSDVELRGRLYGGLPIGSQRYIDGLPKGSCATYDMMVEEAKKWSRLSVKYDDSKSSVAKPKLTPKTAAPKKSPAPKKTATNVELNGVETVTARDSGGDAPRRVFVNGIPTWWSFIDMKAFVQQVLSAECKVYVKMLPSRGNGVLSFGSSTDAKRFIDVITNSSFEGCEKLRARFDRYERFSSDGKPRFGNDRPLRTSMVSTQVNTVSTNVEEGTEAPSQVDVSNHECNNGILDRGDVTGSVTIDRVPGDSDHPKHGAQVLTRTTTGLPCLRVKVGNEHLVLDAMLDSGATDVFLSSKCFDELVRADPSLVLGSCSQTVKMVNGTGCLLRGVVRGVLLQPLGGQRSRVDAYVLSSCNHDMILPRGVLGRCLWMMNEDGKDVIIFGEKAEKVLQDAIPSTSVPTSEGSHVVEVNGAEMVSNPLSILDNGGGSSPERVSVSIPWKSDARPSQNFPAIRRRMQRVLARLSEDSAKLDAYQKAVKELLASGAVEVMKGDDDPEEFALFYTAVTPVIDESRVSTRCRLCLDARPLNTFTKLQGLEDPSVIPRRLDLYASILRWRCMRRVSCEDLSKAFWQVEVQSGDRRFLGMVLGPNLVVRWVRVPFGCGWSPWALSYGIQVAMNDVTNADARSSLDYYVDDLCISASNEADVERSRSFIIPALAARGFMTNPQKRAHNLGTDSSVIGVGALIHDVSVSNVHAWLGYRWLVDDVTDVMDIKLPNFKLPTILTMSVLRSTAARLFDPLGLWGEVTLELRLLLRGLHNEGFGVRRGGIVTKDTLTGEAEAKARSCIRDCDEYLRSNRYVPPRYVDMSDIVCFCDASDVAIATDCRSRDQGQRIMSRLSTHAGGTIPRRELEAIRVGILGVHQLSSALGPRVPLRRCVIVSDSLVSLYRIRHVLLFKDSSRSKLDKIGKPEQRRLIHIYDLVRCILTENEDLCLDFRHISSAQNLADRLTRPSSLVGNDDRDWQVTSDVLNGDSMMHFEVSLDDVHDDGCRFNIQGDDVDDCWESCSPTSLPACNVVTIDESSSWFCEFKKRVQVAQSGDPECVHLATLLRANSSCSQSRFYRLDEETGMLLVREFKNDNPDCWVAKVPEGPLQEEVIEKVHKEYIHPGIKRTVQLIRRHCDFKGLHASVKRYIRSCDVCCRAREGRTIVKGFASAKLVAPVIFGVVGLDLYGPIRLANNVKVWLLVMVCYVSKWMAVKVLEAPDVDHVLVSSMELFYESGVPNMVLSDQGSVFTAPRYQQFLTEHSILHAYTFPYEETRRGWLERPHKEIGVMLRCLQVESGKKLEELSVNELRMWVCRLCFVHNNMVFDEDDNDKELTPWLCNRITRGLDDVLSPLEDDDIEKIRGWLSSGLCLDDCYDVLDSASKELREAWSTSIEHMKELWLERRSEVRKRLARYRKSDNLKIGDIVWKRNMPVKKLGELFSGPFEVCGREGSTIRLKDVMSGAKTSCPIEMLKKGRRGRKRPVKESFMKDVAVQAVDEDPNKVINPDDVTRLAATLANESGVMTRSKKRLLETVSKLADSNKVARTK